MKYILAIDQGTTGTTAHLLNQNGKSVAQSDLDFRQIYPKAGWVEHNLEDIWKSVGVTVTAVLRKAKIKPNLIAAIGITNQRETVAIWDRKSGKPIANAIVWQDRRTADVCQKMAVDANLPQLKNKTGLVMDPYFSATKLAWLLDHVSGARAKAKKGQLACGTMDSFLIWRLTGGVTHATDVSNASRTLLMNLRTGRWDEELCDYFQIPSGSDDWSGPHLANTGTTQFLPRILPSSGYLGVTKGLSFLPDGIPITGVAGDQQAALFGQACFEPGEAKCTFGTGSFLLLNTGSKPVLSNSGMLTTVAWQLGAGQPLTYALEGSTYICGAAVQFLRDQLGFIQHAKDIEQLAKKVANSDGVEFVPALTGLGAPYWDPYARGMICGLTRGSTRAHIARATLEAMALQNTEVLIAMQKDLRVPLKSVKVDGGASANKLLMQIQSDYLGCEIVRPKMIETTSTGAAFLAGLGIEMWESLSDIRKVWKMDRKFTSQISAKDRGLRLQNWRRAVERAKGQ